MRASTQMCIGQWCVLNIDSRLKINSIRFIVGIVLQKLNLDFRVLISTLSSLLACLGLVLSFPCQFKV